MTSAAALRSDGLSAGVHGVAEVGFAMDPAGRPRLLHLYQQAPLRVLFPTPSSEDIPVAAIVTTSGGLVGGDRLDVSVSAAAGCALMVTAQAAEKVYRSAGADCLIDVALRVEAGGWLEYLPQDTILFEGARLRRRTAIERQGGARVLAGEILVFGRTARGESLSRGLIRDSWEVRREGRLAWADALHMDGELAALLADPACFAGAKACATLLYSADDAVQELESVRGELAGSDELKVAATVVNGQLVVRWIALDAQVLRRDYARIWAMMRHRIAGLPQALPRLWHV